MLRILLFVSCFIFSVSVQADIKIATWNIYWLGDGVDNDKSPRSNSDYSLLNTYVQRLDADIIAVQEVENADALRKIFPQNEYNVEMSTRNNAQRTGFAIKKHIRYERLADYKALNTSGGLRYGTIIRIKDGRKETDIMAVHMKSGCFDRDLDSPNSSACKKLKVQVPHLLTWVQTKIANDQRFILLGDFNRRMDKSGDDLWRDLTAIAPLKRVNAGIKPKCYGGKFKEFIDHIIVSPNVERDVEYDSFEETVFDAPYSAHKELSDHCPISFDLD